MKFLFLGDSYTCCEQEEIDANRWPIQLAAQAAGKTVDEFKITCHRKEDGENGSQWVTDFDLSEEKSQTPLQLKIIAKTGKRSDELHASILREKDELAKQQKSLSDYDGVFILIGVNDQFQQGAQGIETFKQSLQNILEQALAAQKDHDASRITVLCIPDWSKTNSGILQNTHDFRNGKYKLTSTRKNVENEISQYNRATKSVVDEFNKGKSKQVNLVTSIEKISREYGLFPDMTQKDGIHYTWSMTQKWVHEIFKYAAYLNPVVAKAEVSCQLRR